MADETDGQAADPGQAFAKLMSGAAAAAAPDRDPEAPFGWTTDPVTGERRPKKSAGRPRKSPSLEDLKTLKTAREGSEEGPAKGDRPPGPSRAGSGGRSKGAEDDKDAPYVPGQIARGVDKLYRRAGKILKAMDRDIGAAVIEATRKDDPADVTVGEAWEEVAKTNPRIRRFLLKMISGGAWGQLVMAHAPIGMAVVMKPAILNRIPFSRLIQSWAEPDESDGSQPPLAEGLEAADISQMMGMAQGFMDQFAATAAAAAPANGAAPPHGPAPRRAQPRHTSRAARRK